MTGSTRQSRFFIPLTMAKDPAFLFYSQDFYTGVATLNFEDRGKYITILCLMHQQGRMSEETIWFLVGSVSVSLKSKFSIDENGLWYNERLEDEVKKRAEFTASRRSNGSKGGRPKANGKPKNNHMQNHIDNHMEDENEIDNYIDSRVLKKEVDSNSENPESQKKPTSVPADFRSTSELKHRLFLVTEETKKQPLNQFEEQKVIEQVVFHKQKELLPKDVQKYWQSFTKSYVDYSYPNEAKMYSHFLSWIFKIPNLQTSKKSAYL